MEFVSQDTRPYSLIPVVFWFYILGVLCREQAAGSSAHQLVFADTWGRWLWLCVDACSKTIFFSSYTDWFSWNSALITCPSFLLRNICVVHSFRISYMSLSLTQVLVLKLGGH